MPLYANQSQTLVDYESTQLVSQDGSIINYDVNDDAYKEASSPDYENYDCLIVADDEPSDQIESSSDYEAANLTAVTLPNGCQAFVNVNADELNLDQDSDGEVQLNDEQALLVNNCSQQLDGQQIQLGDGRIAILHATTERTEGFQAVELEDGTTAFIALSDLMGEPLDPSSFVICENIVSESDIEMDRTAELEDFEVEEIEESKDFPLTQPDEGDEYQSDNESSPNHAYIDVASFNENVNFDESIDEETIIRVHTHTETDDDGSKTEEPSFSDSQNYQALELDNGTICFAVKNDEQKSDSESNELQSQSGDDYRINGFGVRERTKSITCPEEGCGKCYTTLHHLKVHQRAHTGDRPFPCTIDGCTKAFSTGYGRKAHVRTHTGEKPYKCPEGSCEKSFKTSGDLQKHIRTHTGERPFRCPKPECGRSFTTSNIRKVHFRTHTGERPYLCPEPGCGRAFASATNYKNHTRIHSGEKPYICTIEGCSKRFTEYSSLYKHHMVHTQQKPYHCNLCDRHYRQPSTLTMHKRTAHGVVEADDGTEIIMGDTVFAFAEAAAANKRLKTLGANFLSYSKKGNKILTVQASGGGSPDADGQQYLVLTNSMQIAALEHLGVSTSHSRMADDSEDNEEEEDDDDELELEGECILSSI